MFVGMPVHVRGHVPPNKRYLDSREMTYDSEQREYFEFHFE